MILSWREDPAWEIEETEGFEEHKDELRAVRLKCEAEWKARAQREHAEARAKLLQPLWAALPEGIQTIAGMPGTDANLVVLAMAEMLLPIKQQLDRLDAEHERVVADLRDELHELRSKIGASR